MVDLDKCNANMKWCFLYRTPCPNYYIFRFVLMSMQPDGA
jgi:hypothetical protein